MTNENCIIAETELAAIDKHYHVLEPPGSGDGTSRHNAERLVENTHIHMDHPAQHCLPALSHQ